MNTYQIDTLCSCSSIANESGEYLQEELYQACGQMGSPTSRKQVDDLIAEV